MHTFQAPPTRPRGPLNRQQNAVAMELGNIESQQRISLFNVQPRRPKRPQRGSSWNSTFDIYDDTLLLQQHPGTQSMQESQRENVVHDLTQPPSPLARGALHSTNLNAANTTQRRRQALGIEQSATQISAPLGRKNENSEKPLRRRTIYVPPDDTTIMTIHPGASYGRRHGTTKPPRRSDIFLDLATLSESSILQDHDHTPSSHSSKRALSVTPRRAPLQQSSRQLQPTTSYVDIPGSGGGKENIPPGKFLIEDKEKSFLTLVPSKTLRSKLVMPDKKQNQCIANTEIQSPAQTTVKLDVQKKSTARQNVPNLTPSKNIRQRVVENIYHTPKHESRLGSKTFLPSASPSPRSSPARFPHRKEKTPTKLGVPLLGHGNLNRSQHYPVLAEHISNPALYEENWLTHQEIATSELVNSLFKGCSIDKDLPSHGQTVLRKSLLKLYDTEAIALLHKRLLASLRFGALSISNETLSRVSRIKDDVGQSRKFLDFWLKTFDQGLLRAAAEVVIGREMTFPARKSSSPNFRASATNTRGGIKALEGFLNSCLLRNQDIPAFKTGSPSGRALSSAGDDYGSLAWSWRRLVTRSLLLMLLMDKAALSGAFPGCVFQNSSPYKSSASALQSLSSLLLPSTGAPLRILGTLSYQVTHVQYPLQEYSYDIDNLATDLRDGVRLTRLVELLIYPPTTVDGRSHDDTATVVFNVPNATSNTQPLLPPVQSQAHSWPLSQQLRYPCASRVQRVYNVQVALDALHGINGIGIMLDHVQADDIVDGHREKTVGLLWSIVGRWGLGMLVDFDGLSIEIQRLKKSFDILRRRNVILEERFDDDDEDVVSNTLDLDRQTSILLSWARHVARLHGVTVANLSTSFADGRAYQAVIDEYARIIPNNSKDDTAHKGSTSTTTTLSESTTLHNTLRTLGCSNSFIALFPAPLASISSSSAIQSPPSIPTQQTTIPLLAFLASRLLPLARPHFAVLTLQRWWRNLGRVRRARQMWGMSAPLSMAGAVDSMLGSEMWRQRKVKASLARDCKDVVVMRQMIVVAAVILQRWWRTNLSRQRTLRKDAKRRDRDGASDGGGGDVVC